MTRWKVLPTPEEAALTAASIIAECAQRAVQERGRFQVALSGGSNGAFLAALGREAIPWESTVVHQVDERIAPAGDPARNLTALLAALPDDAEVRAMPVEGADLQAAADLYAEGLPDGLDVVQLGLGDDGHTASLVPGEAVLDIIDREVAVTGIYRGHRRMTLTYPVLDRARLVVWLATGPAKSDPLRRLLAGDEAIPAARVRAADQVVVCDVAAAPEGVG